MNGIGEGDVATEHRLTRVEGKLDSGIEGINDRLDRLNGKVARHEEYISDAKLRARELKGFAEGRAALRKKDLAILGFIITVFGIVAQFIPDLIKLIGDSSGS